MTSIFSDLLNICRVIASRWAVYVLMVAGLSLSYCATIVIGLYIHGELTYDRFLPGADRVYLASASYGPRGRPLIASDVTPAGLARWMKSDFRQVDQVARLNPVEWPMRTARRHVKERFYWADANIFSVLQLPVYKGDLHTALRTQGSVVLTRRLATAYFGTPDAIGKTMLTKGDMPLHVTAILEDIPANSHMDREMFVSGAGGYAMLTILDGNYDLLWPTCYTYVTLKPGIASASLAPSLFDISRRHWRGPNNIPERVDLVPLLDLHFRPSSDGQMKPRGHANTILALGVVAVIILALASINSSGLMLAEANERGIEMGLRVALGARRADLIGQILFEAVSINACSVLLAMAMAERILPELNVSLGLDLTLWAQPAALVIVVTLGAIVVSLVSGLYPAIVMSRPYGARHAKSLRSIKGFEVANRWRGWVVAQLSLVIILLVATSTMSRQWNFAVADALHFNGDNVLMVRLTDNAQANRAFVEHLPSIPGVQSVAQSFGAPTTEFARPGWIRHDDKEIVAFTRNSVDPSFLTVYKVPLLAGRNLSGTYSEPEMPREIILNLSAVRALNYARPEDVIGKTIEFETDRTSARSEVIGVIPDIRFSTLYDPMQPMIFDNFSKYFTQVNVRLRPENIAQTLNRIDALWSTENRGTVPIERRFFNEYLAQQYEDLHQQMRVFNIVSTVAILLSTFGLTGLSIFLTRHQRREMAIHRAMGATFLDIVLERTTPFLRPLLFANLIGWALAWFAIDSWLKTFSSHVPLSPWSFIGAGVVSVAFALGTISAHSALSVKRLSLSSVLRHK